MFNMIKAANAVLTAAADFPADADVPLQGMPEFQHFQPSSLMPQQHPFLQPPSELMSQKSKSPKKARSRQTR
jgi:hypothetical protein